MKSTVAETLPVRVRRSLAKLGADIALARRKRSLTVQMMAERLGVAKSTYLKIEKGDPSVALGTYAMAFFVLGFDQVLGDILDARHDEQGLLLDQQRIPKRVRPPKAARAL
ncbi:helix-turn-helix domain-containing protein [Novosphingobium sp. LASN5T]|uniref:helix-turn-helix domain-containing protein n=1 Tax=Novosphingobium sp. LASN5T TaxID=2491021 RepID=UPI000F5FD14F|nr:helix-turn-helix domain-containing protein [Novosphingobium sp. LASN5T]RQW46133.1 helix-turn-helix domain-containing protein [Novosphingobium sp. LASN5T]